VRERFEFDLFEPAEGGDLRHVAFTTAAVTCADGRRSIRASSAIGSTRWARVMRPPFKRQAVRP